MRSRHACRMGRSTGVAKDFSKRCVRHDGNGVFVAIVLFCCEAVQYGVSLCAPFGPLVNFKKNLYDLLNRIPTASSCGQT